MALERFAAARNSSCEISAPDLVHCDRADRTGARAFAGTTVGQVHLLSVIALSLLSLRTVMCVRYGCRRRWLWPIIKEDQ